jgi:hypothetical protein
MALPPIFDRLRLPVIGSPLFIVSAGPGHRPVQGGGRQLPGAECPAADPARRMAPSDHRGTRGRIATIPIALGPTP